MIKNKSVPIPRYLTAKKAERIFGVKSKTLLNRSNLPKSDSKHIPSVRLKGGSRTKYFDFKVLNRLFRSSNKEV